MEYIADEPGLKVYLTDEGQLEFVLTPEEAPFTPPGYVIYEGEYEALFSIRNCAVFQLSDGVTSLGNDTMIHLENNIESSFNIDGLEYSLGLNKNDDNRLSHLVITLHSKGLTYAEKNKVLFKSGMEVLNNISFTYGIPVYFSAFLILHENLSYYSFIDKRPQFQDFKRLILNAPVNSELWHHATGSYRRSQISVDPMAKYLYLYVAIEGVRACIKDVLGLPAHKEGRINHKLYKEPILERTTSIKSSTERFNISFGTKIYDLLFSAESQFREYRNHAAHTISKYDGDFKSMTNLDDYLDYCYGSSYLNDFFHQYMKILNGLTTSTK